MFFLEWLNKIPHKLTTKSKVDCLMKCLHHSSNEGTLCNHSTMKMSYNNNHFSTGDTQYFIFQMSIFMINYEWMYLDLLSVSVIWNVFTFQQTDTHSVNSQVLENCFLIDLHPTPFHAQHTWTTRRFAVLTLFDE